MLLLGTIYTPAKASYYTYGNGGDYIGKLNLYMKGSTRYGVAGTYIANNRYIVNTIIASIIDNGVTKAYVSDTMSSGVTTDTVVCNNSGVVGKHIVYSPSHGDWRGTT